MKNLKLKLTATLAGFLLVGALGTAHAATWQTTNVNLEVLPGVLEIFAPGTINFPDIAVTNNTWHIYVDVATMTWQNVTWSTISWSYFWVTDLKWAANWYHVTLQSDDLVHSDTVVKILKSNIELSLSWTWWQGSSEDQWWIFILDSYNWENVPPEVTSPTVNKIQFGDSAATIISRSWATTPTVWRVWMYWLQPVFDIYVPKYQQLWNYTSTFTMTLIED